MASTCIIEWAPSWVATEEGYQAHFRRNPCSKGCKVRFNNGVQTRNIKNAETTKVGNIKMLDGNVKVLVHALAFENYAPFTPASFPIASRHVNHRARLLFTW